MDKVSKIISERFFPFVFPILIMINFLHATILIVSWGEEENVIYIGTFLRDIVRWGGF